MFLIYTFLTLVLSSLIYWKLKTKNFNFQSEIYTIPILIIFFILFIFAYFLDLKGLILASILLSSLSSIYIFLTDCLTSSMYSNSIGNKDRISNFFKAILITIIPCIYLSSGIYDLVGLLKYKKEPSLYFYIWSLLSIGVLYFFILNILERNIAHYLKIKAIKKRNFNAQKRK